MRFEANIEDTYRRRRAERGRRNHPAVRLLAKADRGKGRRDWAPGGGGGGGPASTRVPSPALRATVGAQQVSKRSSIELTTGYDAIVALMLGDTGDLPAHRKPLEGPLRRWSFRRTEFRRIEVGQANLNPVRSGRPNTHTEAVAIADVHDRSRETRTGSEVPRKASVVRDRVARISPRRFGQT